MFGLEFSRTSIRFDRSPLEYSKVQQAISAVIRNRAKFVRPPADGTYLDIGCGPNMQTDFCNLDYAWRPGVSICWDICNGLPIEDDRIAGVFSEHCFEHISFTDFLNVARELRRIMKKGAWLRIVVPDFEIYARCYLTHLHGALTDMPYAKWDEIGGIYTPAMSFNRIMRKDGHLFIYDFETLKAVLEDAGFHDVQKHQYGKGHDPKLLIDTPSRAVESLYVEARK